MTLWLGGIEDIFFIYLFLSFFLTSYRSARALHRLILEMIFVSYKSAQGWMYFVLIVHSFFMCKERYVLV